MPVPLQLLRPGPPTLLFPPPVPLRLVEEIHEDVWRELRRLEPQLPWTRTTWGGPRPLTRARALVAGSLPLARAPTPRGVTLVYVHVVTHVDVGAVDHLVDRIREQAAAASRNERRTHLLVGTRGADLAGVRELVAAFNQAAWVEPWARYARARLGVIDRRWGAVEADRAYAGSPSLMRFRLPIPAEAWHSGRADGLHVEDLATWAAAA